MKETNEEMDGWMEEVDGGEGREGNWMVFRRP